MAKHFQSRILTKNGTKRWASEAKPRLLEDKLRFGSPLRSAEKRIVEMGLHEIIRPRIELFAPSYFKKANRVALLS